MHSRLPRLVSLLLAVVVIAAACGGDDDTDTATADDSSTAAFESATGSADTADSATAETGDATADDTASASGDAASGEPDAALVSQIATAILGGQPLTGEALTCLDDATGSDQAFADALAVVAAGQEPLTDEGFASLVENVRTCGGADAHNQALSLGVTFGEARDEVTTCLASAFEAPDGADAYVALTALILNIAISPEAQGPASPLLAGCVPDDILAQQFAGSYEQRNTSVVVDVACLTDALPELSSIEAFWDAFLLTGEADVLAEADELAAGCAEGIDADLLQEVPDDFEPWSGTGALAAVAPAARNDVYTEAPPMTIDPDGDYQAVIATADGEIVLDLYADTAPVTVNTFVALARDGFYDRTTFHRVLPDFMAQGGDPTGTGSGGPGFTFEDEVDDGPALDRRGLLAMANSGPDTNGSQFFITFVDVDYLTGNHTVFGEVVEGDDVLAAIDLRDPDNPTGRGQVIESITIVEG